MSLWQKLAIVGLLLPFFTRVAASQGTAAQSPTTQQTQNKKKLPQGDLNIAVTEAPKEPPPSAGATVKEEIEAGIKAQPACLGNYNPCSLTKHQKLRLFEKKTRSPFTFATAAFNAGYSQISGDTYGPGLEGVAKRYGANLADTEARSFFQTYALSAAFHQDPRYHRISRGGIFYRAAYAASRVVIGRTDNGGSTANWPEFLGVAATVTLGNAYYPERDSGPGRTINRGFGSLLSDAGDNVLREFWPDIRKVLRRHEPKPVQRIEQKIGGFRASIAGEPTKP